MLLDSVQSMAGLMKHLKYIVDRRSLEQFYFTFIRPKLEYGNIVWDNCTNGDADKLEQFQLEIARTVTGAKRGTSHALIYNETGWPKLCDRRSIAKLKTFIKMRDGNSPPYLCALLPPKVGTNRPNSRHAEDFVIPKCRTELFRKSFIPSSIQAYNKLDAQHRNIKDLKDESKFDSNVLFNYGKRGVNIICAQLRMKCSNLHKHLYDLHVINSPACACGHNVEDVNHYLLECPLYMPMRNVLFQAVSLIVSVNHVNAQILLFGAENLAITDNLKLVDALHNYITSTARFT